MRQGRRGGSVAVESWFGLRMSGAFASRALIYDERLAEAWREEEEVIREKSFWCSVRIRASLLIVVGNYRSNAMFARLF